jgi:hypothetical protein
MSATTHEVASLLGPHLVTFHECDGAEHGDWFEGDSAKRDFFKRHVACWLREGAAEEEKDVVVEAEDADVELAERRGMRSGV